MHQDPSIEAQILRELAWDGERQLPAIPPGTMAEEAALAAIDAQRSAELATLRRQARPPRTLRLHVGGKGR